MYHLLLAFFIAFGQSQTSQKIYSVFYAGADVVSYAGTQFTAPLSYASNLVFNPATSNTTMWLLADEGSPNVRSVGWDPTYPPSHGFWLWSSSYIPNHGAAPFFSFSVVGENIMGTAYASNDEPTYKGIVLQSLFASPQPNQFQKATGGVAGYTFVSIVATEMDPADHTCTVFLAGWAMDASPEKINLGFVVARGTAPVNDIFGKITIAPEDISDPIMDFNCFDVFSVNRKPYLWLNQDASVIVLVIPGRCSTFAKFTIPNKAEPFQSVQPILKDPTDTDYEYVSGATLDRPTGMLWYAVKKYNSAGAVLKSFDISTWNSTKVATAFSSGESDMIMTVGRDGSDHTMLYVLAAGANYIYRWNVTGNAIGSIHYASLPSRLNQASSAIYVDPYLYFTTYEPAAEVVRISNLNFCSYFCGNFSWCNGGTCACEPLYSPILADDGTQAGCIPTVIHQDIIIEEESSGLVSVSAVLFSFTAAIAIAGWYSFVKRRQERQNYQPLVERASTPAEDL